MSALDMGRALLIVLIWGVNFVAIKIGLQHIPPFALGALRFAAVALPAVFFVARPRLPWRWLFAYALCISFGQFAFLFIGMRLGMPAGLASLVLQVSAPFTLIFSAYFFKESVKSHQIIGMLISAVGLVCLASYSLAQRSPSQSEVSWIGFTLTVCAGASWALGNVVNKHIARSSPVPLLNLVIWGALVVLPFFTISALWFEGLDVFARIAVQFTWQDVAAIAYIAYLATIVGYVLWGGLLARYPASWIAPITLMVPPIGLTAGFVLLNEHLMGWQIFGIVVVMVGLLFNVLGHHVLERLQRR
ncbi:putative amino-acid metabolite efflux pump [Ephemeroptericola cinctiostellae]|uniref:Putative amino-acid metabolite efflux pump n=1 Tax=Ephemeroptericola cinctiostellae TaxID=2268024 RepID=A0A345DED1_9BURK|nr:EamA family transporter [Ephemeroptericola cinctiostellae]AXF86719.1 putative amino-acid metabolite efflux pump [Ephemeroptericola cinctiostellae]